jgi:hypothetical protein
MYADDLLLLAISLHDLQAMVDICVDAFDDLDLEINLKKQYVCESEIVTLRKLLQLK